MTTHPLVGNRQPPAQSSASKSTVAHARPPIWTSTQPTYHTVIDPTNSNLDLWDVVQPPFTKQENEEGHLVASLALGEVHSNLPEQELWKENEGRPYLHTQHLGSATSNESADPLISTPIDEPDSILKPCPPKPWKRACERSLNTEFENGSPFKSEVQMKPYVLSVPPHAPRCSNDQPADFFPWIGTHPEDTLSDNTTKQGYYDKIHSQNETNTARPSVWSSLKHKSGLNILSSLFTVALDHRQAYGTVTASSTFKPPPRVTLTDTKRESWLKDLADPAIPLRRLSRTIPHGVRGKILLDHCLSKAIPINRAVWLAKCVGANEIRAFKRKGTSGAFAAGGELKWIKEWTSNFEQFVGAVIAGCGHAAWSQRVTYALRLSSHLFLEHLLDREHYLTWIIESLDISDIDSLSVWLLISQIYWKEILQFRQFGRLLAEALLKNLQRVIDKDCDDLFSTIKQQLTTLLLSLAKEAPACFLLTGSWLTYETAFQSCFIDVDSALKACFKDLKMRNTRLIKDQEVQSQNISKSVRSRLITLLDGLRGDYDVCQATQECLEIAEDSHQLVMVVLEWTTTLYRVGLARTYIATQIFCRLAKMGVSLTSLMLTFLASSRKLVGIGERNVYRVITELVRSGQFSVSKYLQWLMARGLLDGRKSLCDDDPCEIRLLCELPLYCLPAHLLNLRRTLLASVGYSVESEEAAISAAKIGISERDPAIFINEGSTHDLPPVRELKSLNGSVRSDLSYWIRQCVASQLRSNLIGIKGSDIGMTAMKGLAIDVETYNKIQEILEELEDFTILADVLRILKGFEEDRLLACVTDTLSLHFEIFESIGVAEDLFRDLCFKYDELRSRKLSAKSFLISLIDLGELFPTRAPQNYRLRREMLLYDQKAVVAACSPVSDYMAESLQSAESDFVDEMDQILTSGSIMDSQVLSRLFKTIIGRMEMSWSEECPSSVDFPELLSRLRPFEPERFEQLIMAWLNQILPSTQRPRLLAFLPSLICNRCTALRTITSCAIMHMNGIDDSIDSNNVAIDMLEMFSPIVADSTILSTQKQHRYRKEQQTLLRENPLDVVRMTAGTIRACSHAAIALRDRAQAVVSSPAVQQLLRELLEIHPKIVEELAQALRVKPVLELTTRLADSLLDPESKIGLAEKELGDLVTKVVNITNEFNIPFCQLKLLSTVCRPNSALQEMDENNVVTSLTKSAITMHHQGSNLWVKVISVLDMHTATKLRENAESELLCAIPSFDEGTDFLPFDSIGKDMGHEALLTILSATGYSIPITGTPDLLAQFIEKIASLSSFLLTYSVEEYTTSKSAPWSVNTATQLADIQLSLGILLRALVIYQHTFSQSEIAQTSLPRLILVLSSLLVEPSVSLDFELTTFIFDVLSILTDGLSKSNRLRCVQALREHHKFNDVRLIFLLGSHDGADSDWLQLIVPSPALSTGSREFDAEPAAQQPFPLRKWEMMQEATPVLGENDTSLSLGLFGAREAII